MRLAVAKAEGGDRRAGLLQADRFQPLVPPYATWEPAQLAAAASQLELRVGAAWSPASDVCLELPARPRALFCADDNFLCQPRPRRAGLALQRPAAIAPFLTGDPIEDVLISTADPSALCLAGSDVIRPRGCERLDVGISLAAVVGDADRPRVVAYAAVLDFMRLDIPQSQAFLARSFPTHKVVSHALVTADEVASLGPLKLELVVDGKLRQHSTTEQMIASASELAATIGRHYRLRPGDMILTGSPAGRPGDEGADWIDPGSLVEGRISGVGVASACVVEEGVH